MPVAAALAACQFEPAGLAGGPGDNGDRPDADPSTPDASAGPNDGGPGGENCGWPFAPRHFDPCAFGIPTVQVPLVLDEGGVYVYDTDDNQLIDPGGASTSLAVSTSLEDNDVRALWVDSLDILDGSTLRVKGRRPLMIVSTGEIRVRGGLDVSSVLLADNVTYDPAAGSSLASDECADSAGQIGNECAEGGGGGGGGGFRGAGADGGRGAGTSNCNGETGSAGGSGGDAVSVPSTIRGGCPGARGGNGDAEMLYGLGGPGGGAVHLVSQTRIDIEGTVQAGGAAGSGAENNRSGGGGGGSGGYIGLEAPDIEIDPGAILAANGGAGGGGCNNGLAGSGQNGRSSDQAAIGGAGQSTGGDGGNGSAGIALGGELGQNDSRGGGGGGGGAGFIITYQDQDVDVSGVVISPPLTDR